MRRRRNPIFTDVHFESKKARRSIPPGHVLCLSIIPTPSPMVRPPSKALTKTGRSKIPFKGKSKSIARDVIDKPNKLL